MNKLFRSLANKFLKIEWELYTKLESILFNNLEVVPDERKAKQEKKA